MAAKSLIKVWDASGKAHDMSYPNARDMVRLRGWSLSAPPVAKPKSKKDDEPEANTGKPDAPRRKKLEQMSRKDLCEFVAAQYQYQLDAGRDTAYMVWIAQQFEAGLTAEEVDAKMVAEHGADFGKPGFVQGVTPLLTITETKQ